MRTISAPDTGAASSRRGPVVLMAVVAMVALAVVVAGGWWLLGGDDMTTEDYVKAAAAEMRAGDVEEAAELFGLDNAESTDYRFVAWHIGWDSEPEFTQIVETTTGAGRTNFTADVTYSDDSFYSQAIGETATTTLRGWVDEEGTVYVTSWPPPHGLTTTEGELRDWVQENRPELFDEMFGTDYAGIRFSQRSGELRMEVLDDFLVSR